MIRRPPRSTQSRSSAASDVYKRQTKAYPELKYLTLSYCGSMAHFPEASIKPHFLSFSAAARPSENDLASAKPDSITYFAALSMYPKLPPSRTKASSWAKMVEEVINSAKSKV